VSGQVERRIDDGHVLHHPAGSIPHDAATMTFGLASSIRADEFLGGEASEHHRVDGTQAGARQHGDHGFGIIGR
jgi:hypothetical protein